MLAAALSLSAAALAFVLPPMHSRLTPGAQQNRGIRMQHDSDAHCTVIFLRHGQSTWNEASLFTGWANVELTTLGKNEAARAATQLWSEGHKIDVAYTSLLKRAQQTLDIVLRITGQEDVPVHQSWRLNERMYGDLTGLNKKETAERFGAEQVKIWRRSYDTPPPPIDTTSQYWPGNDNEYAHIKEEDIPLSECLKDTVERTLPYWQKEIVPALKRGKTVLIAAHGNSIRGMLNKLDSNAYLTLTLTLTLTLHPPHTSPSPSPSHFTLALNPQVRVETIGGAIVQGLLDEQVEGVQRFDKMEELEATLNAN